MLKHIGLGILLGLALWLVGAFDACAQVKDLKPVDPSYLGDGYVTTWKDPQRGCIYIASFVSGRYIVGSVRFRSDGKPDCPGVDKK